MKWPDVVKIFLKFTQNIMYNVQRMALAIGRWNWLWLISQIIITFLLEEAMKI
jgi:hypothetical protein